MTIRIAVIGAGVMGADHARILAAELPGAVIQVVCDASAARARAVADECGAADAATDAPAVIARSDVDAVVIASPDDTHAELALAAIAADKPVLCEKPLAPTARDCRQVIEAETRRGRPLVQLGFMRRFDPSYAEMKSACDDGRLGRVLMMHNFHRNVASPGAWFTADMAITNSAGHEFDIVRHVLGSEPASIAAWQPRRSDDMAAPVVMILETADRQLVSIEVNNNAAYGYDVRAELVGELGAVSLATPARARYERDLQSSVAHAADWRPRFAEAYRLQNRAWLRAIETGKPSAVAASAWDGYCAAATGEAGVRALQSGQRIAVDLGRAPTFYRDMRDAA